MNFSRSLQYGKIYKTDPSFTLPGEIENAMIKEIKSAKTGFCGDTGSYSETAAKNLFPDSSFIALDSFEKVCEKVYNGETEFGVLPLENTTAGTVNDVYDYLIKYNLYIVNIITHNHGGSVHVEETPGGGATFVMQLPLAGELVDGEIVLNEGVTPPEC
jgi:hypothetical protein